jgi:hypothetical protein
VRQKYTTATGPNQGDFNKSDGRISLRQTYLRIPLKISNTIGRMVDVYYDRENNILSIAKGSTLTASGPSTGPRTIYIKGIRAEFGFGFTGRLEAKWNEYYKTWDIAIPTGRS